MAAQQQKNMSAPSEKACRHLNRDALHSVTAAEYACSKTTQFPQKAAADPGLLCTVAQTWRSGLTGRLTGESLHSTAANVWQWRRWSAPMQKT